MGTMLVGSALGAAVAAAYSSYNKNANLFEPSKIDNTITGYGAGAGAALGLVASTIYVIINMGNNDQYDITDDESVDIDGEDEGWTSNPMRHRR